MFSFNVLRVALSVCLPVYVREFFLFSFLCVFPFHTSFYVLHVSAAAAAAVAAVRISACIVFPLGENFSTIANIVLKAAITVPLRSLAPAKPSQAAAPEALDICIRSARTGRTLSPAAAVAVTWIFNGASQRICLCVCACVRAWWMVAIHCTHTHGHRSADDTFPGTAPITDGPIWILSKSSTVNFLAHS